jgi:hypothetical protein
MPDGYPNADAREWASFINKFMSVAKTLVTEHGKSVEIYDASGSVIGVVEVEP